MRLDHEADRVAARRARYLPALAPTLQVAEGIRQHAEAVGAAGPELDQAFAAAASAGAASRSGR